MAARLTQKSRILALLKKRPHYNYEFFRLDPPILRAAARIEELRKMGWPIKTERVKRGVFRYRLGGWDHYKKVDKIIAEAFAETAKKNEQLGLI